MSEKDQELGPRVEWIREKVESGSYIVSEHIIRLFTSRKLDLSTIITVLREGKVTEYRRNVQKRMGSIVKGSIGEQEISVLCEKADDNTLGILLAYVVPTLNWLEDATGFEDTLMEEIKRRCFFCGEDIKPIVVGNFDYRLDGDLFVVKKVPAGLCLGCGEKYIESEVAHAINNRVKSGEYSTTDEVRVLEYSGS